MAYLKTGLCLFVISMIFGQALGDCGGTLTNTTGQITNPVFSPNSTCIWYIVANSSTAQVMLLFDQLSIKKGGDNLTVYAGNDTKSSVITNYTSFEGSVLIISPATVTKIVLSRGPAEGLSAKFSARYNTKECSVAFQGSQGIIKSPVYLNGTGTFTCSYKVDMATNKDTVILSFQNFSIPAGNLSVQWNNETATALTGSNLPDDIFRDKNTTQLTLTLTISNNSAKQQFSASFQAASPACSGLIRLDAAKSGVLLLPSANQLPVYCYAQIVGPSNNTVSVTTVSSLLQGVDSVIYVDGGTRNGLALGNGNDGLLWHVSNSNKMTIVGSFGATNSDRVPLNYTADSNGKFYQVKSGQAAEWTTKVNGLWQIQGPPFSQLKLNASTSVVMKGKLRVQDEKMNDLFNFSADTLMTVPVVSPGSRILVQTLDMSADDTFSVTIEVADNDCSKLYTADSGDINFNFPTAQNTCFITVNTDKAVSVQFSRLNLQENTNLEIYAGNSKTSQKLAVLDTSAKALPPMYFKAGSAPRFVWKKNNGQGSGPVFSLRYWATDNLCGGNLTVSDLTASNISSPWYPNQYPVNCMCTWTVPSRNNSFLFLSLNAIQLGTGDSLQVMQNSTKLVQKFNGSQLTDDVIVANSNLSVTFTSNSSTDLSNPGQGVSAAAYVIPCGGLITNASANFSNPANMTKISQCLWIVQIPATGSKGSVNILDVTLNMQGVDNTGYRLEIHDGGSIREPVIKLNKTGQNTFLSRYNRLVVHYVYINASNVAEAPLKAANFNFSIKYTTHVCNKSSLCANGICMHDNWRCNGVNDCGDDSDERNCVPVPTPHTDNDKGSGVKGYWVAISLFIGLALGTLIILLGPKCFVKLTTKCCGNTYSRNYDNLGEAA